MNRRDSQALMKEFKNLCKIDIWKQMLDLVLELIYPNTCVLCGKMCRSGICSKCEEIYKAIEEPRCMCCGKPIQDEEVEYCYDCKNNRKIVQQGRSIWVHKGQVKQSIYRFKYKNHRIYSNEYARKLIQEQYETIKVWGVECILPVPIHRSRRRARGYNQALVLAQSLQREWMCVEGEELPISFAIYRKRETLYQKKLDNKQRKNNLQSAFGLKAHMRLPKRVLIVDDIYTTGATIQEISKLLVKVGVEQVFFVTISIGQGF